MAGGLFKLLGILVLVVGTVALVAGVGAAGFGMFDEQGNDEGFLSGPDRDRTDRNQAMVLGGGITAGAGVLLVLLGVVLIVTGGWVSTRRLHKEIRQRQQAPPV